MENLIELEKIAGQIRRDIIRMVHAAKSGHPGGSLGCADLLTALYFKILNINPDKFTKKGDGEDMMFFSNGHITPVIYSVLARRGFFPIEELKTFRKLNSRLQGHPTAAKHLPGIRVTSGSLGQGVSIAIGAAMGKKINQDDNLVYVLTGDGELQEGQPWEAFLFAGDKKVDNLIVLVDYNKQQSDGPLDVVLSLGDLKAKFEAFNWTVVEMNGNVMQDVVNGLKIAKNKTKKGKPVVVLAKTEMGAGVDFMEGNYKWHGTPPNDEQAESALAQLPVTLVDF